MYLPDELLQARHGATAFEDLGCYKMLTERRQGNERGCWAFRTGTDSQSVAQRSLVLVASTVPITGRRRRATIRSPS